MRVHRSTIGVSSHCVDSTAPTTLRVHVPFVARPPSQPYAPGVAARVVSLSSRAKAKSEPPSPSRHVCLSRRFVGTLPVPPSSFHVRTQSSEWSRDAADHAA